MEQHEPKHEVIPIHEELKEEIFLIKEVRLKLIDDELNTIKTQVDKLDDKMIWTIGLEFATLLAIIAGLFSMLGQ